MIIQSQPWPCTDTPKPQELLELWQPGVFSPSPGDRTLNPTSGTWLRAPLLKSQKKLKCFISEQLPVQPSHKTMHSTKPVKADRFPINSENEMKVPVLCPGQFFPVSCLQQILQYCFPHNVWASAACSHFKIQQQNSHFPCGKRMTAQLLFQESRNVWEGKNLTDLDRAASTREEKGDFPSVKTTCPEMCFNFLTKWTRRE